MKLASVALALTLTGAGCGGAKAVPSVAKEAALASAPSSSASAARPQPGSAAKDERAAVEPMLARVSKLRGVAVRRRVPAESLEREALVGRIKDKALREFPPDELRRQGQILRMLGFAPPSFDYLAETMTLLGSQLAGFYEPDSGTMFLASDLHGTEAQATLAHELVHALQDQSWDLKARSRHRPGQGDETLALGCLAEGDATSLMMDFLMQGSHQSALDLPEQLVSEGIAKSLETGPAENVPHILQSTLVAPYIDGLAFVNALRRKGDWSMVNRAWEAPPTTTEQILHVDKWESHEPALKVPAPTARALGEGFVLADEDSWGELGFALAFEEWLGRDDARAAASGWGGDRAALYARADELAFAMHLRYDEAAFAKRAHAMLAPRLKAKLGRAAIDAGGAVCFERPALGPLVVMHQGDGFILTTGPARALPSGEFTSAATCARAKAWAAEVAASEHDAARR